MPEISKIRLVLNQEDKTFEIKDSELREALGTLLGDQEEDSSEEE